MQKSLHTADQPKDPRSQAIFDEFLHQCALAADRMFGKLLIVEWLAVTTFAILFSPEILKVPANEVPDHILAATLSGALLTLIPWFFIKKFSGAQKTRHVIATAQMLYSALFVQLTAGRVETHFHIFGSLAFLILYRDNRIFITASLIAIGDHFIQGVYFPNALYSVTDTNHLRALEHGGWILFIVLFLVLSNLSARRGIWRMARTQRDLEGLLSNEESKVKASEGIISAQEQSLIASAKLSAVGEMAGQVAHEINTPLGAIVLTAQALKKKIATPDPALSEVDEKLGFILEVSKKIARIINSMRKLAAQGGNEMIANVNLAELVSDTLLLAEGRLKKASIEFSVTNALPRNFSFQCRANEISQVLINLLNNAHDAVRDRDEKWIRLEISQSADNVAFRVSDSGPGITAQDREKLFLPQFTTKSLDHGTGFGLTICKRLIEQHGGQIFLDSRQNNTSFVFEVPIDQSEALARAAV